MSDINDFSPLWGEWYIKEQLGKGAFGSVYKAEKVEYGNTYVSAIKHLSIPSDTMNEESLIDDGIVSDKDALVKFYDFLRDQMINEINLCYALRGNTNIVSYEDHCIIPKKDVYGYDVFIRMEFLTSLPKYMRDHKFTENDVIRLGRDICEALDVINKHNIIHRDIKPANIFMNSMGVFKLGDFGESKVLSGASSGMTIRGTYAYMSPEISRGSSADITSDIYSLGVVLYRMLNKNKAPFVDLNSPTSSEMLERANIRRFKGERFPLPFYNNNQALTYIVMKACEYDPANRWQSPKEMKKALEALEGFDSSTSSQPLGSSESENKNPAYLSVSRNDSPGVQNQDLNQNYYYGTQNQNFTQYGVQNQAYDPYGTQNQNYTQYGAQNQGYNYNYNPYGTQNQNNNFNQYGTQNQNYNYSYNYNPYGTQYYNYNQYGTQNQNYNYYNQYGTQNQNYNYNYNQYGTQNQNYNYTQYAPQNQGYDQNQNYTQYAPQNQGYDQNQNYTQYAPQNQGYDQNQNYTQYAPQNQGYDQNQNYTQYAPQNQGYDQNQNYTQYAPQNQGYDQNQNYTQYAPQNQGYDQNQNYTQYAPQNQGYDQNRNYTQYGTQDQGYDQNQNYTQYAPQDQGYDQNQNYSQYAPQDQESNMNGTQDQNIDNIQDDETESLFRPKKKK